MSNYDLTAVSNSLYQIYRRNIDAIIWRHTLNIATDMTTVVAADYVKLITIPANTFVQGVLLNVHTASTTPASTVNVGDSASATQYLSATSTTTTGLTAAAASTQKFYTAADYLRITLGTTAPTNGILDGIIIMTSIPDYAAE